MTIPEAKRTARIIEWRQRRGSDFLCLQSGCSIGGNIAFSQGEDKLVVNHIIIQHPSVVSFPIFNIGHFTPTIFDIGRSEDE